MMLFPAVLMNFPNSKVCLIWGMVHCIHDPTSNSTLQSSVFMMGDLKSNVASYIIEGYNVICQQGGDTLVANL